jgi:cytochrome c biogenesis protein CcmG, thiol:disulfide interchange protein DsbE
MRRRALTGLLAAGLLAALLGYALVASHPSRTLDDALAAGQRPAAPALRLPDLRRPVQTRSLAALRGRVVLVNFFASWCAPCRDEAPMLERWQRRLRARGGTVLGVDAIDARADALGFVRRMRLTYPIARDVDGSTARRFGVAGYPESALLDRAGRVVAIARGPLSPAFWTDHVAPLL